MISFIIIGKNEGWKITNCLKSVVSTISHNKLSWYEILYIDSNSIDDSIERASKFEQVKIFVITGFCNAAVARNIGAKEAKGDILFFIDGDMEIVPQFLESAIDKTGRLKYDCMSGHLDDLFYDEEGNLLQRNPRTYKKILPFHEQTLITNGGIFIIRKQVWDLINGMKTKYERSQDNDFSLRLAKKGIIIVRIPALIALHHTIDYRNDKRMWKLLRGGTNKYTALITREHMFNFKNLKRILRSQYTAFLFAISIISIAASFDLFINLLILYISFLFLKAFLNMLKAKIQDKLKIVYYIERITWQFLNDILFWYAFLFFYPSEKELHYKQIN